MENQIKKLIVIFVLLNFDVQIQTKHYLRSAFDKVQEQCNNQQHLKMYLQPLSQSSSPSFYFQNSSNMADQQEQRILQQVIEQSIEESLKKPIKTKGMSVECRKMIPNLKMKRSKQTCTFCQYTFLEGQIIKQLPCKHILHRDCAKAWLKVSQQCPICKMNLEEYYRKQKMEDKNLNKKKQSLGQQKFEKNFAKNAPLIT